MHVNGKYSSLFFRPYVCLYSRVCDVLCLSSASSNQTRRFSTCREEENEAVLH